MNNNIEKGDYIYYNNKKPNNSESINALEKILWKSIDEKTFESKGNDRYALPIKDLVRALEWYHHTIIEQEDKNNNTINEEFIINPIVFPSSHKQVVEKILSDFHNSFHYVSERTTTHLPTQSNMLSLALLLENNIALSEINLLDKQFQKHETK